MSKEISLTQEKVAIVDDEDFDWLNRWKWCVCKGPNTFYIVRNSSRKTGKRKTILMHRLILGLKPGDPRQCDHKDHNGLNNQRHNLRCATRAQNQHNQKPYKGTSSQFKCVCWHRGAGKWAARIRVNGQSIHLGLFTSEIEAALAYDKAALRYYGEFANMNFGANYDC